jgi:hypothetical protein
MQIDTSVPKDQGEVKTRKEALAEQRLDKKGRKAKVEKPFKEFYALKGY